MKMSFMLGVWVTLFAAGALLSSPPAESKLQTPELKAPDACTLLGPRHFLTGYSPVNDDGTVNMVVEIPAGAADKWEVDKKDGSLRWEIKNGRPRIVKYLGYPCNYGMVPQTVLAKDIGGDGDPLDILLLGAAVPRGLVVKTRVIGVAKFTDAGELDHKLIAVRPGTPFAEIKNLQQLNEQFPGVVSILETWFLNYKGPGVFQSQGCADVEEAVQLLQTCVDRFPKTQATAIQP